MNVLPGTLLPLNGEAGEGVYKLNGSLYSSRVGIVEEREGTIRVTSPHHHPSSTLLLPQIGQTIIGTVTKLTSRYVGVDISVLEGPIRATHLQEPFKGTLRSQDVWPADDKEAPTQLNLAYRPGDLIRARIIGMGDASAGFLLSTALEETLGVIFARCTATGEPLVPSSWNEMICCKSGIKEARKPAKP